MTDLVEFIRARIAEDREIAKDAQHDDAVTPGVWITEHHDPEPPYGCHIAEDRQGHYWCVAHDVFIPVGRHIARQCPAATLARCDALDALVSYLGRQRGNTRVAELAKATLRLLSAPWSSHPDYRQEWAA